MSFTLSQRAWEEAVRRDEERRSPPARPESYAPTPEPIDPVIQERNRQERIEHVRRLNERRRHVPLTYTDEPQPRHSRVPKAGDTKALVGQYLGRLQLPQQW